MDAKARVLSSVMEKKTPAIPPIKMYLFFNKGCKEKY